MKIKLLIISMALFLSGCESLQKLNNNLDYIKRFNGEDKQWLTKYNSVSLSFSYKNGKKVTRENVGLHRFKRACEDYYEQKNCN